jgi:DNA-binding XRE family transcriptional regulator
MKGFKSIPRILRINSIDEYKISCLFSNGESRIIDFQKLFLEVFKIGENDPASVLLKEYDEFKKIKILGNTLGWPTIGIYSKDKNGKEVFYPYDLDPIVLYQNSVPDPDRSLVVGLMIKKARKEAGLTQEQLAKKSGTSKHYISRIENNKSDIELLTLKKIVEAGLGKTLTIRFN